MNPDSATEVAPDPVAGRTAEVLAAVLERAPRTMTELAEVVGSRAIEVAPLVAALEHYGMLAWEADRTGLRPGPVALRFARSGAGPYLGDGDRPRVAGRRAEHDPRAGLRDDRRRARVRALGGRGTGA